MRTNTLKLSRPFGAVPVLAALMFLVMLIAGELVSRTSVFQNLFAPPSMGSRHSQLGPKLSRLESYLNKDGSIDCLMVGSSIVDLGFDPPAFVEGYREATGQEIYCVNFGIDASTAASVEALVNILLDDYSPRLLIYMTEPRDYVVPPQDRDPQVILETEWVRYRNGAFSLSGWFTAHSYFYRYRSHLFRLAHLDFESPFRASMTGDAGMTPFGQSPEGFINTTVFGPPDEHDDSFETQYLKRIYGDYKLLDENLGSLERMMQRSSPDNQVIVVEMPPTEGINSFLGQGERDYDRFASTLKALAEKHGTTFFQTSTLTIIPNDGWFDYNHLNETGAAVFSHWLGSQVGTAVIEETLYPIKP